MIYTGRPNIPDNESFNTKVKQILDTKRLTNNGPFVKELEERLSNFLGVKHVISVCNATIGLIVATNVLLLKGEVILPSFTFIASAHALEWQGIKPVFCDIDPIDHNIDVNKVEELITDKTTGIMGVHLWGRPCNHDRLLAIARKHNLALFYDAAHAFNTTYGGRPVASLEDLSVLSFHATKCFHTFEGGAIVTENDELAQKARLMINYSFEDYDNVTGLGLNAKMSEIHAAMGVCNLDNYDTVLNHNKLIYEEYRSALSGLEGIRLIDYNSMEMNNYHYIVIEIDEDLLGRTRDDVYSSLHAHGIIARRYFYPGCHQSEPYKTKYPYYYLPQTDKLCENILVLPGGSSLNNVGQIDTILSVIREG